MLRTTFDLARLATGGGSSIAVIDGDVTVTYDQLDRDVNRVANGLLALGLQHQDRVAFVGRNGVPCVELLLGAARAGLVPVILNWRLHPSELEYVLTDSKARLLVVTSDFADAVGHPPAVETVLVVDRDDAAVDTFRAWRDSHSDQPLDRRTSPDDVATQLYTSGTTGRPKGAMLTFAGFAATIPDVADVWELDATCVVLSVLPMFHIAGVGTALAALDRGSRLLIDNDARTEATIADVEQHGVTNLVLASVLLQGLVTSPSTAGADLSTLRTVGYGAAPITQQVLATAVDLLGCSFVQAYGLTETTGVLTVLDPTDHRLAPGDQRQVERLRSCGRARPGVELRVVDTETGVELPAGEVGEVIARSPRTMRGYWNQPAATAEVLDADGWFHTGDLGSLDEDGYLFLSDRLKDMIVSGGENVYPAEVEDALQWHPAVAEVAVIGVPHERWGETPCAVVVAHDGRSVTEGEVIEFARERLAHYKCPTSVQFVDQLPRNAAGKVLRRTLREPHWAGRARRIN